MIKHLCLLSITVGVFTNITLASDFRRTHGSGILLHAPTEEDIEPSQSESSPRKEINNKVFTGSIADCKPSRKAYRTLNEDLDEDFWGPTPRSYDHRDSAAEDKEPISTVQSWPSKIRNFLEYMVQNIDADELPIG